jgi:AcrR family transcriptional regulator
VAGRTKAEQRLETRRRLMTEARRLFARHGYAAVSLTEIARAASVTKGAVYHNFAGKADLFHAIVAEVQDEVADRVAAAADACQDPWDQLLAGCRTFLAVSRDPDVQRIMLIDGPSVLGWNEWRAMDEASSARHLTEALTALVDDGTIADRPVEPLTHLLSGAMNEAALWLARSTDPGDLPAVTAALTRMLESLRDRPS